MKTIEEIKKQMVLGATSVEEHREAPTAQAVTEFRQTLLTDFKAISANGSAELIVAMEKALAQHDLEYYANSKTMIGSLNTALSEFAMIERQLAKVDDPAKYKATDQSFGLAKNRSKGLPLDEARQAFKSHYARLVNLDKAPLVSHQLRQHMNRQRPPGRDHRHPEAVAQALARGLSALDIRPRHHPLDQPPGRGPAHRPQRRVAVRPRPPLAGAEVEHQLQAFWRLRATPWACG